MATRTARNNGNGSNGSTAGTAENPLVGFSWKMAAVIEGTKETLVPGTVVEVTTSKGKVEHVTIGAIVEEEIKFGVPFVKVWPADRKVIKGND